MIRGAPFLLLAGAAVIGGCAATPKLEVRALADPASKLGSGASLYAEARGQLALGNVGLALEAFRTLERQQPESAEVYAGIAECYAAMGRFDLTRTNYEIALAYAPNSPALLQALARTLDKLGESEQATQVRTEVRVATAKAANPTVPASSITPLGVPKATSITVKLPQATPAPILERDVEPQIAPAKLATARVDLDQSRLATMNKELVAPNAQFEVPRDEVPANVLALAQEAGSTSDRKLNFQTAAVGMRGGRAPQLPQRAMELEAMMAIAAELPATSPAAVGATPKQSPFSTPAPLAKVKSVNADTHSGPHLERTSLGEVALITLPRATREARLKPREPQLPRFAMIAAPPADRPPTSPAQQQLVAAASLRWVPLRYASRSENIALLNAARTEGLAARTRMALVDRGWHKIAIGNARKLRQHSLVLYAPGRWHVAARLAAQFRCKAVKVGSLKKNIVVLLGRDIALGRGSTSRA